ncbi:mucin-2-like [Dreissena polymorpha]|nr:mucin-2-like [Dreissena polymorpha]
MHFLGRRRQTLAPNTADGDGAFHNTTTDIPGLVTPVVITTTMQLANTEETEVIPDIFLPREEVVQTATHKPTLERTTPMLKLKELHQHKFSRNKTRTDVNNNGSPQSTTDSQHSTTITSIIHLLEDGSFPTVRRQLTPTTPSLGSDGTEPTSEPSMLFQEITGANPRTVDINITFLPLGATPELNPKTHSLEDGNNQSVRPNLMPITTGLTLGSERTEPTTDPTLLVRDITDSNSRTIDSNNAFPPFGATPEINSKLKSLKDNNTPTDRSLLMPITTSLIIASDGPEPTTDPTLLVRDITDASLRTVGGNNAFPPFGATPEMNSKTLSLKEVNDLTVRSRVTPITTTLIFGSEGPEPSNDPTLLFQGITDASPRTVGTNITLEPFRATPEMTSNINSLEEGNTPPVDQRLTPTTTSLILESERIEPTNEPMLLFQGITDATPRTVDTNITLPPFRATPEMTSNINSLEDGNTPPVDPRLTPTTTSLILESEGIEPTNKPTLMFQNITDANPRTVNHPNDSEVVDNSFVTDPLSQQDRNEIVAPSKLRFPGPEKRAEKRTKNATKSATSKTTEIIYRPQNENIQTRRVVLGPLGSLILPRAPPALLHVGTFPVFITQQTYSSGSSGLRLLPGNMILKQIFLHAPAPYPIIDGSGQRWISCTFGGQCAPHSRGFNQPTHVLHVGLDDK